MAEMVFGGIGDDGLMLAGVGFEDEVAVGGEM